MLLFATCFWKFSPPRLPHVVIPWLTLLFAGSSSSEYPMNRVPQGPSSALILPSFGIILPIFSVSAATCLLLMTLCISSPDCFPRTWIPSLRLSISTWVSNRMSETPTVDLLHALSHSLPESCFLGINLKAPSSGKPSHISQARWGLPVNICLLPYTSPL